MKKPTDLFIEDLVGDLRPGRDWSPETRALSWLGTFTAVSAIGMMTYQAFRPHFLDQLLEHSRFSMEMVSIFLACNFLLYFIFSYMVPGRKTPQLLMALTALVAVIWAISQWMAFGSASPASSFLGARMHCKTEVLAYGLLGIGFLFYFVYKSDFPFKLWQYFAMGFVSGLIPGALMQLACLYDPRHGLTAHYAPALLTGVAGLVLLPVLKKLLHRA